MNGREFLKSAGVLCTVAVLALYASPGDADPLATLAGRACSAFSLAE